jgi:hypothetical protein
MGPWYRPDMAIFIFAKAILEGTPVRLFNFGNINGISLTSTTLSRPWYG